MGVPHNASAEALLEAARGCESSLIDFIRELVECESPSDSPAAVNRFIDLLTVRTADCAAVTRFRGGGFGDHLLLEFMLPATDMPHALALGHADTVWPIGTLSSMPFRNAEGRLWGPGVLDMKTGLALLVFAVRAVQQLGLRPKRGLSLLVVSDEEIGSPSSRAITEREALKSSHVLVLEPGTGLTGKLKTARKGVGNYLVRITGKASHAGVDFENGASAIIEAAHVVQCCAALTDLVAGTTVNPGLIRGGTRSNVIAAEAVIEVDVRAVTAAEADGIDTAIRSLRPSDSRCTIHVAGGLNRPPMQRSSDIADLFARAAELGSRLGLRLEESATGGGSDGNFTAALGIPTLDGLGAVGEGAHAPNESVLKSCLHERVALLASLIVGL